MRPWGPCHPPGLPSQEQKGSKKKRDLPKELHQDPPILKVLGSGLVVLEPLLVGESVVSTVCNFGVIRTLESDRLTLLRVPWGPCHTLRPEMVLGQGGPWGQVVGEVGRRGSERPLQEAPALQGPGVPGMARKGGFSPKVMGRARAGRSPRRPLSASAPPLPSPTRIQ